MKCMSIKRSLGLLAAGLVLAGATYLATAPRNSNPKYVQVGQYQIEKDTYSTMKEFRNDTLKTGIKCAVINAKSTQDPQYLIKEIKEIPENSLEEMARKCDLNGDKIVTSNEFSRVLEQAFKFH